MTTLDRTALPDEKFIASCQRAFRAELAVAHTCIHAGAVEVTSPHYRIRPSFGDRGAYRDRGDLRVRWRHGHPLHHYEVKHRDVMFTGLHDYPYATALVDEVEKLDGKDPRPDGYFLCNAPLDAALFVDVRRRDQLRISTKVDSRYGQGIEFYVIPVNLTRCIALNWR